MVAVCVVAHALFPVTSSFVSLAGDPSMYCVRVRKESGELTDIELSAERSAALHARHGHDLPGLAGRPWIQVLAEL